jgi:hypothetical protein
VYTLDLRDGAEPQCVAEMDATLYPVDWSRSGRYLLIVRYNTNLDTDLYLLDLQSPGSEARHLTPHTGAARYEYAVIAPEERGIYLLTDAVRDTVALAYLDLQTLAVKIVLDLSWDIDQMQLSPDGTRLVYAINEGGYHKLIVRDVVSGTETPINGLPKGIINRMSWARTKRPADVRPLESDPQLRRVGLRFEPTRTSAGHAQPTRRARRVDLHRTGNHPLSVL